MAKKKHRPIVPAVVINVVPVQGTNAYRLLRDKVSNEAMTWRWSNKARTRLRHSNSDGYIDIGTAYGVVVARVFPKSADDLYFLVEKFIGRLVAWFEPDLASISVQFVHDI